MTEMTSALYMPDQIPERHIIRYRILNHQMGDPVREVEVYASPEEIQQLVEKGYLVRKGLIKGQALERLRNALDEVTAIEMERRGPGEAIKGSRQFGGIFLRHLADKHPAFLELVRFQPTLSVARAVLGPLVQIRGMGSRIVLPGETNRETEWHQHQQVASDPLAPWFVRPHGLDCLIYLDEIDENNGPICVLPGSHQDILKADLPPEVYDDLPGQVELHLPAGSIVMMHCMLWHRAKPPKMEAKRRLILLNYTPTWMKQAPYGVKPVDGLTQQLLQDGNEEARELLGLGGYT